MLCARDACTNSLYYILMDFVQQAVAQSYDSDFFLRHLCWRRLPRRAFVLRRGTPSCSGFSLPRRRPGRLLTPFVVNSNHLLVPLALICIRHQKNLTTDPQFRISVVNLIFSRVIFSDLNLAQVKKSLFLLRPSDFLLPRPHTAFTPCIWL